MTENIGPLFDPYYITLSVVKGKIEGYNYIIDDVYDLFEPTERVVHIVAPKKKGVFRIKTWPGFDPNPKSVNTKGRPPLPGKKEKHKDSLKTCISFLIRSLDPRKKKKDHTYNIKLDIFGQLNITGIVWMERDPVVFDEYVNDCFGVFENFINTSLDTNYKLEINREFFASLNIKAVIKSRAIFDRDNIYRLLVDKLSKHPVTDYKALSDFCSHYFKTGNRKWSLLNEYSLHQFRYNKKVINKFLDSQLKPEDYSKKYSHIDKEFWELVSQGLSEHYCGWIFDLIKSHHCNLIQNVSPRNRGKGGVTLFINVGYNNLGEMILKKANIYMSSTYNSYCNTYAQADFIHNIIERLFVKYYDIFVVSNKVKFELID